LWADDVTDDNIAKSLNRKYLPGNAQRVYCIESDLYFDTELEGAQYAGVDNIRHSLNNWGYAGGKHPITGELLHWLFAKDVTDENINKVIEIASNLKEDALRRFREKVKDKYKGENSPRAKFTENDVKVIIQRLLNGERSVDIAKDYNRKPCAVSDIKNHRAWTHLTQGIVFPR
jgi:hypothetical protein